MKTSKYIYSFMLAVALAFAGCSDFLDSEDNSNIAGDNFYQTEDDFRAATAPLYNKVWFDFNDKFYYGLGDGRGFNLCATTSNYIYPFADLTETGLTGPLVSAWGSLYNIVQQTNKIINGIKGNSSNSEEVKNPYIAEARFMRGVAYSYLAMLWGNVIINEDTDELVANPIVNTSPVSDVYEFAMRDLEFAAKSVSQFTSTITPTLPPVCIYDAITPSDAALPDLFCNLARPFSLKYSTAFSMSPLACFNASLQSIRPTPVFSLNFFTSSADISINPPLINP